jgi:hypothetical protein
MFFAILGLEPSPQRLHAFTGIAGAAAERNVLFRDYPLVVHDVFPTRAILRIKRNATIHASSVPQDNLLLKPSRYVPTVHSSASQVILQSQFPTRLRSQSSYFLAVALV